MSFLTSQPKQWLGKLVNNTSNTPQWALTEDFKLADVNNSDAGTASVNCLDGVIGACLDPSMARYCGFADVDDQPLGLNSDSVVAYIIRGTWQLSFANIADPDL